MVRSTPPRPVDVEAVFPELAPFRRTAVRLHPRAGRPTCRQSSVGGPLLWPADEPWPRCPEHAGVAMVPVVQLRAPDALGVVPFPAGCDLLQVLWCALEHGSWVVPLVRWRAQDEVAAVREALMPPRAARRGSVPRPCVLHPETVSEYPSWDLPQNLWDALEERFEQLERQTGWDYQYHLSTAPGVKLAGYPGWSQDPRWPDCAGCGALMEHLLTVESCEEHDARRAWTPLEDREDRIAGPELCLGDLGGVYLFECRRCPGRPAVHRYDS
ncbi:DUF1963 domain-containing protein [Kitasatospora sp. NPDC006697]|uniref:DUF1963 domain-containing protein n=1 Tax=Kitasatospora sp. NPDC006697 TaxID=3364020 RepID=UPI0036BB7E6F